MKEPNGRTTFRDSNIIRSTTLPYSISDSMYCPFHNMLALRQRLKAPGIFGAVLAVYSIYLLKHPSCYMSKHFPHSIPKTQHSPWYCHLALQWCVETRVFLKIARGVHMACLMEYTWCFTSWDSFTAVSPSFKARVWGARSFQSSSPCPWDLPRGTWKCTAARSWGMGNFHRVIFRENWIPERA